MAKRPRPYSKQFTARGVPRRYLLSGIPPTLWETVRAKAKREGVAVRTLILQLLQEWALPKPQGRVRYPGIVDKTPPT